MEILKGNILVAMATNWEDMRKQWYDLFLDGKIPEYKLSAKKVEKIDLDALYGILVSGKSWNELMAYDDLILNIFYNVKEIRAVCKDLTPDELNEIAADSDCEDECWNDRYNEYPGD